MLGRKPSQLVQRHFYVKSSMILLLLHVNLQQLSIAFIFKPVIFVFLARLTLGVESKTMTRTKAKCQRMGMLTPFKAIFMCMY